jgi:hypothetical protein
MTWEMLGIFSYASGIEVSSIDWAQLCRLSTADKDRLRNVFFNKKQDHG